MKNGVCDALGRSSDDLQTSFAVIEEVLVFIFRNKLGFPVSKNKFLDILQKQCKENTKFYLC